jgi:tungstate transport system substrate-binding protein
MNTTGKIIAAALIVIIVAAVGTYAYMQSTQPAARPSPSPSPTATPTPTPNPTPMPPPITLTISSTTSLHDTGLEDNGTDSIKAAFEAKYPWITVNFLAQGTGAALQTAQRGDADMVMVHAPSQEATFLDGGYGVNRKIIAYNFFVIVGPADDPAHVRGMTPTDAMEQIYTLAQNNTPSIVWVSRNDSSGTCTKEKALWTAAGLDVNTISQDSSWFKSTGSGMGQTLLIANEFNGYTISDTGTYLAYYTQNNIQLDVIVDAQKDLLNVYCVMADNPLNANLTGTHFDTEMLFIQYMVSDEGQQVLANYGVSTYEKPLFSPFMPLVSGAAPNATLLSWIQSYAYIPANATECPAQYRYNATDLYSAPYDALPTATANASVQLSANGQLQITVNYEDNVCPQPLVIAYNSGKP